MAHDQRHRWHDFEILSSSEPIMCVVIEKMILPNHVLWYKPRIFTKVWIHFWAILKMLYFCWQFWRITCYKSKVTGKLWRRKGCILSKRCFLSQADSQKIKDEDLLLAHEKVLEVVWSVESSYITQPTQQGATKPHRPLHMEQYLDLQAKISKKIFSIFQLYITQPAKQ